MTRSLLLLLSLALPLLAAAPRAAQEPAPRRVLLLGDSISIGYHPFVVEALRGEAVVVRPPENCAGTTHGVASLDRWLALQGGRWDVIHFNFGLHDLKRVHPETGAASNRPEHPRQADPARYEEQYRRIFARLKATGARLVCATTTPVPSGRVNPHRDPGDVPRYNAIAVRLAREYGAAVNDLYAFALPRLQEIQRPANVHFTEAGSLSLAGEVARTVREALRAPAAGAAAGRLNVIVVLVDDLGATDLGCTGSRFYRTPNLDRLAREGLRFTQAYSACTVCSPTRAALLTGKYPARLHITDWIEGHKRPRAKLKVPDWTMYLPLEERTLAEAFRSAGYATASIGKWHLGGPDYYPEKHGFDRNVGGTNRGQPPSYFSPYRIPTLEDGPPGEFLTDREAREAVRFLTENRDRPFFLYLPHHAVHTPIQAKPEVVARYRERVDPASPQRNPQYAALVESVDDAMGTILEALDRLDLARRTLVLFTSDNGGLLPVTSNLGLRAGKGSAYEGGVRVPLIVRWPGVVRPGSTTDVPVITPDHAATLLEAAGIPLAPGQVVDGRSYLPLLRGEAGFARREPLYWHYPHYHPGGATPYGAIRDGDWRLVEFYEDGKLELYNLRDDPREERDLAAAQPERTAALRRRLDGWRRSVGAQMPTPNPDAAP